MTGIIFIVDISYPGHPGRLVRKIYAGFLSSGVLVDFPNRKSWQIFVVYSSNPIKIAQLNSLYFHCLICHLYVKIVVALTAFSSKSINDLNP